MIVSHTWRCHHPDEPGPVKNSLATESSLGTTGRPDLAAKDAARTRGLVIVIAWVMSLAFIGTGCFAQDHDACIATGERETTVVAHQSPEAAFDPA